MQALGLAYAFYLKSFFQAGDIIVPAQHVAYLLHDQTAADIPADIAQAGLFFTALIMVYLPCLPEFQGKHHVFYFLRKDQYLLDVYESGLDI